ncbi:hypothetical protein [uncultured Anaerococcus sp.]|uniref:hypothetical protein n=1 Tax=uncultured Anaerococcus sp. TaxID=293428 RepID=UPI00288904E2|nr:hypothetical protein [uncultured Anaerococcus sp.]
MDYKKYLSYLASLCLGLVVIGLIYSFAKPKTKSVANYKINEDLTYTGMIYKDKFQGEGVLKTKDGLLKASFDEGRPVGDFAYKASDYYYFKVKDQVIIKFKDGKTYKKADGKWEEIDNEG